MLTYVKTKGGLEVYSLSKFKIASGVSNVLSTFPGAQ